MQGRHEGPVDIERGMYGPDVTFLGVPRTELGAAGLDVVVIGAPYDGGTSHRPGARFGPQALRTTDYLPHDASRPHLALGVDPLTELRCADAGDVLMPGVDTEASLRRLQTDYIDLYQMHHIDRRATWDEVWEAFEVLRTQGKILYVGSSNFAGWHIARAQEAAGRRNFLGLVSEQSIYNLIVRNVEAEVLPAAEAYGLGVIPWSPLQGGLLGGVVRKERDGSRRYAGRAAETIESRRSQLEAYEDLCTELGEEPGTVGLAWLLSRPAVTAPIVGPRTPEHFTSALRAVEVDLDEKTLARLDELFPGHKTAPEDYAW